MRQRYFDEVIPNMMKQFSFTNPFQVPRLEKIVVNVGAGEALQDSKVIDGVMNDLAVITGQQPIVRKARKSIAGFKLRKGVSVGAKVTLRGDRMYEFLDRLISVVVPRIRDFRGFERKSFDGAGNYTLGLDEQLVFPEIDYDKVDQVRGMNITMVTTARNDAEGLGLLENFGFPLKEKR
ncbi:MAG: 50S ribosomal protein L5 [Terriglobia bacterium]